jgi:hypothetical protein
MFERYNEPARRALFFARYEASQLGSVSIETKHLLLGILKDRDPLIAHLVGGSQSADAIRRLVYERAAQPGSPLDTSVELPFSKDAKRALQCAAEEATRLLHGHIGPEHLLLGLLRHEQGFALEILKERGLALSPVREALVLHVNANMSPPPEIAGAFAGLFPPQVQSDRSGPVFFMTALDGSHPGRRRAAVDSGSGHFGAYGTFSTVGFTTPTIHPPEGKLHSIGPISMSGTPLGAFAQVLEGFLDRPVIDQTGIDGLWDIELRGELDNEDALTAALRDQLGLLLTKSIG